jgi:uncharacterized membrane-anchored protein
MKNLVDNMNDILNIEGELVDDDNLSKPPVTIENNQDQFQDVEADYRYARSNLYDVIEKGTTALDSLLELAKASEHPRAFEVVGQLTKTLVDANKDLIALQKNVKDIKKEDPKNEHNTVNNNLFVGSTSELLKIIKKDS